MAPGYEGQHDLQLRNGHDQDRLERHTGFTDVGGVRGVVKVRFSSPSVYLTYNYTDALGNDDALAIYEGTLSADRNTVTGTVGGTWEDNCTFTMRRK